MSPSEASPAAPSLPAEPRILFEWYPAGGNGKTVVVADAEADAEPMQIVPDTPSAEAVHAQWSRDGSQFAWEVLGRDGSAVVWIANADGSDPRMVAQCEEAPCAQLAYPSFSPDGTQLLVTRYDSAGAVWGLTHQVLVDLASGVQTVIASTPDALTAFRGGSWSPDGTRIAVWHETFTDASQQEITANDIVIIDTDPATDEALTPITDAALFAGYPRWHPTDDRILFSSWDLHNYSGDEPSQLYTMASDGSGLAQLTHVGPGDRRPGEGSWTPDGTRIMARSAS